MQNINSNLSNNIYPVQFEGAVRFKRAALFDARKLCSFEVDHPKYKQLNITTTKDKHGEFNIEVRGSGAHALSKERFCMFPQELYGVNIKTHANYRRQSLGEISRITSIMTMLQNNLSRIKIYSIGDAVIFHHKYKFEPNITERADAIRILNNIRNSGFKEYKDDINTIMVKSTPPDMDYTEFCQETNKLVQRFLDDVITNKRYNNRTFQHWNLDMVLTREKVIENKEFFNNVLKKHHIEYNIE